MFKTQTKAQRIVKYSKLIEKIKEDPKAPIYLCVDLGITNQDFESPELELFTPDVETEEMDDSGWFGRGSYNPDNNATRIFVLAMMIEMAK